MLKSMDEVDPQRLKKDLVNDVISKYLEIGMFVSINVAINSQS